jgi:hypothetical protein
VPERDESEGCIISSPALRRQRAYPASHQAPQNGSGLKVRIEPWPAHPQSKPEGPRRASTNAPGNNLGPTGPYPVSTQTVWARGRVDFPLTKNTVWAGRGCVQPRPTPLQAVGARRSCVKPRPPPNGLGRINAEPTPLHFFSPHASEGSGSKKRQRLRHTPLQNGLGPTVP